MVGWNRAFCKLKLGHPTLLSISSDLHSVQIFGNFRLIFSMLIILAFASLMRCRQEWHVCPALVDKPYHLSFLSISQTYICFLLCLSNLQHYLSFSNISGAFFLHETHRNIFFFLCNLWQICFFPLYSSNMLSFCSRYFWHTVQKYLYVLFVMPNVFNIC